MKETFRLSMLWLHTWAGVVIGSLLFIIFWMGTLSVFNYDIDRWMMPDTRIDPPEAFSYDAFAEEVGAFLPEGIQEWGLITPRDRIPMAYLYHRDSTGVFGESVTLDLARMEPIPDQGTLAGTGFIFPFHYSLHLSWKGIGYWIVGAAAMAMMLLLITGVIVHIRIFKDFFTLRPKKKLPRSTLDLHNLSGVLALPFHFMIALSGVIIFMNIYFPQAAELAYAEEEVPRTAFFNEAYDFYTRPATGEPLAESFSIDAMVATAAAAWDGIPPYYVRVIHPGDANSYVYVRRSYQDHVHYDRDVFFFDAATGEVLHHFVTEPVMTAQHFLIGFHIIQFDHWALRWLYFLAGLTGCILIGTGFIYWMEKRRKKHEELGMKSIKIVEMLTIGSVTGIIAATALFFVVNRILPLGFELGGIERSAVEVIAFYLFWIGTFAHAWVRRRRAWSDQLWATAVLSVAAVVLNALTTGGHMIQTAIDGQWNVFGMDALLLATAALCVVIARRLDRKAKAELVPPEKTTVPEKAPPVRAAVRPASRIAARPGGRSRTAVAGPPEGDGAATRTPAPIAPPPTAQQSDDT